MPNSALSSRINVRIWAWTVTSSAVVGSSAIRTLGRHDSAMAITTRCRMPPESSCGYCRMRRAGSVMWTASSMARARASGDSTVPTSEREAASLMSASASANPAGTLCLAPCPRIDAPAEAPWVRMASVNCAPIVMTGLSDVIGSWKIIATSPPRSRRMARSGSVVSSRPASVMEPLRRRSEGDRSRMIESAVSDLPEPDSPARHSVSPGASAKPTPSSTGRSPSGVRASMHRSSTVRIGDGWADTFTKRRCAGNSTTRASSAGRRSR